MSCSYYDACQGLITVCVTLNRKSAPGLVSSLIVCCCVSFSFFIIFLSVVVLLSSAACSVWYVFYIRIANAYCDAPSPECMNNKWGVIKSYFVTWKRGVFFILLFFIFTGIRCFSVKKNYDTYLPKCLEWMYNLIV